MNTSIFRSVLRAGLIPRLFSLILVLVIHTMCQGQSVTLDGSGTDPEGATLTFRWRQLTGPVLVTFTSTTVAKPSVSAVWKPGVYSFELTVTDPGGLSGRDTMTITVTQPTNAPPKSNAGPDKTITLPAAVAVIGLGDAPGLSVEWVKMSGPSQGTIKFPNQSVTDVTGLVKGQYVFRKIVRNSLGVTGSDDVTVTVKYCSWWMKLFRLC